MKIDFSGVDSTQQEFLPIPSGKYIVEVTDYRQGTASASAKNAGADTISWELTVQSTLDGSDSVKDVKVAGRKVWENMTIVEASFWRLKAFLEACGFDVSGEIDFDPDEVVDSTLVARVGIQPSRKNKETGEEYDARNQIKAFYTTKDAVS
jgi:hypothetical protein